MNKVLLSVLWLSNKLGGLVFQGLALSTHFLSQTALKTKVICRKLLKRSKKFVNTTRRAVSVAAKRLADRSKVIAISLVHRSKSFLTSFRRRVFSRALGVILVGMVLGLGVTLASNGEWISQTKQAWAEIPSPQSLSDFKLPAATLIYDQHGTLLYSTYAEANRIPVSLKSLPPMLITATLAAEDKRFYKHHGVDPISIVRASVRNLTGDEKQGGSTLTPT